MLQWDIGERAEAPCFFLYSVLRFLLRESGLCREGPLPLLSYSPALLLLRYQVPTFNPISTINWNLELSPARDALTQ